MPSHYLDQCWLDYWCIYASLGLSVLMMFILQIPTYRQYTPLSSYRFLLRDYIILVTLWGGWLLAIMSSSAQRLIGLSNKLGGYRNNHEILQQQLGTHCRFWLAIGFLPICFRKLWSSLHKGVHYIVRIKENIPLGVDCNFYDCTQIILYPWIDIFYMIHQ